jgi:hypothetical protein
MNSVTIHETSPFGAKMTSWYELLEEAMRADGEDFHRRVCTLDEAALKIKFDAGHGEPNGQPFTAWGEQWVYFPLAHDGAEWVGHAPRHPCSIAMRHQDQRP